MDAEQWSLWKTLRDAVNGVEHDLTTIPLRRAIILLSIPTLLEMSMESLFAIADIFYVSKLGRDPVATVGLTESLLAPVYAMAMGLASAATAIIARRIGEKRREAAAQAAAHVALLAVVLAIAAGVLGSLLARGLFVVMGAEPSVVAVGSGYAAVMLGGSVTILLLFVFNAIFRGTGAAAVAMRALWIANGLNILVAPLLVFGIGPFPRLGVTGAAIATTASRGIGIGYQVLMLRRGRARVAITRASFAWNWPLLREIFRIASAASLQTLVETLSWLALVRILATYGGGALAGYAIAMRIVIFALLPSWGLSMAASTLVGQNLGAKAPERAEQSVRTIGRYNLGFLGLVGVVFVAIPHPIVSLFTGDPEVAAYATDALRIVALGFVLYAYGMVCLQAFNGAGDSKTPMFVNVGSFWFFKIPLAYALAMGLGLGPRGVFLAIAAAYSLQAVVAYALFRRGSWKAVKIA